MIMWAENRLRCGSGSGGGGKQLAIIDTWLRLQQQPEIKENTSDKQHIWPIENYINHIEFNKDIEFNNHYTVVILNNMPLYA